MESSGNHVAPPTHFFKVHDAPVFARLLSQLKQSLSLSVLLVLIGWSALYFSRSTFTVQGTILSVEAKTYPWSSSDRFDLRIQTNTGHWLRFASLRGSCDELQRFGGVCKKKEFPIGGSIRFRLSSYSDPNSCSNRSKFGKDRCFTADRPYLIAIEVGGQPVTTGWAPNLSVMAPFGFVVALSLLLAWNGWQVSQLRVRTILACMFICIFCFFGPAEYF